MKQFQQSSLTIQKRSSHATSGGRREKIWGISCEKSRFYAKKSYFFPILGGRAPGASRPWEHIVVSNMMKHLEIHDILVYCQHGFRAKRNCETQLISLTHELLNYLQSGIQNELTILDFSKAFDKVPHKKLLCKLDNYGIRDTTLKWIWSFLSNRMQQVVLDGSHPANFQLSAGYPRGLSWDNFSFSRL